MKLRRITSLLLAALLIATMCVTLGSCGEEKKTSDGTKTYTIGICQLAPHVALDAATQGFKDAVVEILGEENVKFDDQNANGNSDVCPTIINQFVSNKVDLILANATAPLQAAAAATADIPILGTSITHYGTALEIENWSGKTGVNISGTSDLAPLDQQAAMIKELFPETKNVGILFCSSEANSKYQATEVAKYLKELGIESKEFTFSDTNDIASVTAAACAESDVLYVPTDNAAADNTGLIDSTVSQTNTPIIAGEQGICAGCGVATLSISYYDIGYETGKMAAEILKDGADITNMDIRFAPKFEKLYNKEIAARFEGLTIPEDYAAIEG